MIRPAIQEIEPYRPGPTIAEVKAQMLGLERVVKLGSNETALPPLRAAVVAAARAGEAANRYPDPWCTDLREDLAARHGVTPEQIVPGNGADELIRLICQACLEPGKSCVFPWPGFPTHAQGTHAAGGIPVAVEMPEESLDLDRVLARIGPETSLVCVANPNNPTGAHASVSQIEDLLERLPDQVLCLLDEAYFGFVDPALAVDGARLAAEGRSNLCVVRTFSKAYGLAGFRVGYAVASPSVADALNRIRTMFNVNQPAQAAALESLARQGEIEARCASVRRRRDELAGGLAVGGLEALPSQGNFIYSRVREPSGLVNDSAAGRLADALLREGVIVRRMESFGAPWAVRITVGTPAENSFLLSALERVSVRSASPR